MEDTVFSIVGGIACYYKKKEGPCILWLHGYTMNAFVWENIYRLFPANAHLAIDLPSHGASCSITKFKNLPELANRLNAIAKSFEVQIIFGLSFGGIIGLQMACEAPDSYKMLFLNSAPIGGGPLDSFAQTKNLELIRLYNASTGTIALTEAWMKSPPDIFTGAKQYPLLWQQLVAMISTHRWEELSGNLFSVIIGFDQTKTNLSKINFPIKIIIGEDDMDNIKRCSEIIKRLTKNSERIYIPDSGHLAILEKPEIVASIILDFIKEL
ncbi:MAG: alpha/beta hydrolase [Chitinophagaceae bacterium]|nr:alpha/beta hydrolase [Chitinophagaceae bacterium]